MIHAHHKSAAHADDGHNGCECVLPNVHDAHLSLGCAERCLDHRLEMHFLLQNVVVEIGGRLFDTVQEPALRHAFVLKVGQRKLAHAEVPVWMACPFDVQITRKAEIQLKIFSHQFIHNGTVVNPPDGNSAAVAFVEELVMSLPDVGYGDGLDP